MGKTKSILRNKLVSDTRLVGNIHLWLVLVFDSDSLILLIAVVNLIGYLHFFFVQGLDLGCD